MTQPDPSYIQWLEDRSMLKASQERARLYSGQSRLWQNPYAEAQPRRATEIASVWLTVYPDAIIAPEGGSVLAALAMRRAVAQINLDHRQRGWPEIGMGVGLNTGVMCVGDMGSNLRRSYTVIGDAVNLGSRLEGLGKHYGVDIVVSETTRAQAGDGFTWQELDTVKVKGKDAAVVCMADSFGDRAKGQTAMENCLQKAPDVNVVYTINEPAAAGAYQTLKAIGREKDVLIVSVDGGCPGVQNVKDGVIGATSQQYPLLMASKGIEAIAAFAKDGTKPAASDGLTFFNTGVNLVTDKPAEGVPSIDTTKGTELCWG